MSAAKWRRAMNARTSPAGPGGRVAQSAVLSPNQNTPGAVDASERWWHALAPRHGIVLAIAMLLPFVLTPFLTFQVMAQSLVLGLIALSLTFLGGYGGMVSLAQMTLAGVAGYAYAVLSLSNGGTEHLTLGWPWWLAMLTALLITTLFATLVGWLSVRTEGIYTIMITLAIGVAFYYLVLQNYSVFNGFQGLREIYPPPVFGIEWRDPLPFYFLALGCALVGYCLVKWVVRAPFGIALQGIRDNPRRMAALGFDVVAHRVAAYTLAGLIAGVGGILFVWYNGLISPGSVGTGWLINILVIAVLGGMKHPIGAFLGALVFVLLQTFAIDIIDRERFNLVIGGVFLAIVLFSPDGLLGLWEKLRARLRSKQP